MINFEEYEFKMSQFVAGKITNEDWREYCKQLLREVSEEASISYSTRTQLICPTSGPTIET